MLPGVRRNVPRASWSMASIATQEHGSRVGWIKIVFELVAVLTLKGVPVEDDVNVFRKPFYVAEALGERRATLEEPLRFPRRLSHQEVQQTADPKVLVGKEFCDADSASRLREDASPGLIILRLEFLVLLGLHLWSPHSRRQ